MKFKYIYPIILIIQVVIGSCNGSEKAARESRPNIVIILSDDQGWGDLSISGNPNLRTPNIDRLAQNGASFDRFYVSPVCSPTRAELLTGRYHPRSGVFGTSAGGERMNLDETTIAELFKAEGYATAAFGKWHNGMQAPYHPNARGFDEFYGFCSGHWGDYFNAMLLEHNGEFVQGNGYVVDDFTDKAMSFMENNRDQPFFLYIPYNTPHSPMQVPDEWFEKLGGKSLEASQQPEKENKEHTKAALAMCENIDWNVGRLMKKLQELNLEDNTIVLYFGDNGPNGHRWNGGMKGIKGSTDEGGVRSPLFIQWPGVIKPGLVIKEISAAIDLLPTLADLAGIEERTEKPLDGVSLKPLLFNHEEPWSERLIFSHWNGRTSVRSQSHRLDHQGGLFDMFVDPGQSTDISQDEQDVAKYLLEEVKRWNESVLSELNREEERLFPVGHPDFKNTQLPARDAKAHGNIQRSNVFPNSSFLTNWESIEDKIIWDVEVLSSGDYEVELYYTCAQEDVGASFQLLLGENRLSGKITEAHDPPLLGTEYDRVKRMESYVKDFKPLRLGIIRLEKGAGQLTLQAIEIPGKQVMDFRTLMLKRRNL